MSQNICQGSQPLAGILSEIDDHGHPAYYKYLYYNCNCTSPFIEVLACLLISLNVNYIPFVTDSTQRDRRIHDAPESEEDTG